MADPIQGVIRSPLFNNQPTSFTANEKGEQLMSFGLPHHGQATRLIGDVTVDAGIRSSPWTSWLAVAP